MCDQFHKACKRKRSADQLKKLQLDSINHMRHHISEENQTQFFDDFVHRMDEDLFSNNLATTKDSINVKQRKSSIEVADSPGTKSMKARFS